MIPSVVRPGAVEYFQSVAENDPSKKEWADERIEALRTNNFLTKSLKTGDGADAAYFATRLATPLEGSTQPAQPKVVRSVLPPDRFNVERDWNVQNGVAYKTKQYVPQGLILPSHSAQPNVTEATEAIKNAAVFRAGLEARDYNFSLKRKPLTSERAAELVHRAQTPSEEDFRPPSEAGYDD